MAAPPGDGDGKTWTDAARVQSYVIPVGSTTAAAGLGKAAEALHGLIELAEMTGRSGRTGTTDLN